MFSVDIYFKVRVYKLECYVCVEKDICNNYKYKVVYIIY
jgi:hypothetical protein